MASDAFTAKLFNKDLQLECGKEVFRSTSPNAGSDPKSNTTQETRAVVMFTQIPENPGGTDAKYTILFYAGVRFIFSTALAL